MSFLNANFRNPYQTMPRAEKSSLKHSGMTGVTDNHAFLDGKRCLVLDDEFLIALDIQQTLEAAGAIVISISSAEDALDALHGGAKFDLAVLDIKLSGKARNSTSVAALLSERGTPFVYLTGMSIDHVQAQSFPAAPLVEKPYELAALMAALRTALSANGEPNRAA